MPEMEKYLTTSGNLYQQDDRWHLVGKDNIFGETQQFARKVNFSSVLTKDEKEELFRILALYQTAEDMKKNVY